MTLAIIFAIATALYSAVWMYYVRHGLVVLGAYAYSPSARSLQILSVNSDSPAEPERLQPGDRIVAINERPLDTLVPYYDAISRSVPGDVLTLDVERTDSRRPYRLQVILGPGMTQPLTLAQTVAYEILNSYPLLFLIVGLVVLLQRLEDRNAWLLALLFGGFIAAAPLLEERLNPALRGPTLLLRYANCGHNPPLVLRASGEIDRLPPTAAVIGLFDEWTCTVADMRIEPGDTLVIFTDGVTEAMRGEDEEFGEERLFETIRTHADAPPSVLLNATVSAVKEFSGSSQSDDLTLVIARGRS